MEAIEYREHEGSEHEAGSRARTCTSRHKQNPKRIFRSRINVGRKMYPGPSSQARPSEEEFQSLVREWREGTAYISNLEKIVMHPAYQRIIGLGRNALPFILRELRQKPDHWFWALKAINGSDVAEHSQTIELAAARWISWGVSNGIIERE